MGRWNVRDQGIMRLGPRGGLNQPVLGLEKQPDQASFEAGLISDNIALSRGRRDTNKDDNKETLTPNADNNNTPTPTTTRRRCQRWRRWRQWRRQIDANDKNGDKAPTTKKPTEAATKGGADKYDDTAGVGQNTVTSAMRHWQQQRRRNAADDNDYKGNHKTWRPRQHLQGQTREHKRQRRGRAANDAGADETLTMEIIMEESIATWRQRRWRRQPRK